MIVNSESDEHLKLLLTLFKVWFQLRISRCNKHFITLVRVECGETFIFAKNGPAWTSNHVPYHRTKACGFEIVVNKIGTVYYYAFLSNVGVV
jgi:hypothetical protein